MESSTRIKNTGLRGVTVADTRISFIDGLEGILIYRGYRIEDLAERSSFEETAFLLLQGTLPDSSELATFRDELGASRHLPQFIVDSMARWPRKANPMDILQAAVPLLAAWDPELTMETREANVRKALRLLSRLCALGAAWHRIRNDLGLIEPDGRLSHAENFLWQLTGEAPDRELAHALEVSMILQAEHTFNASTFACREVVSTGAHLYAGVSAGAGALSGSLHGGANVRVLELILQFEEEGKSEEDIACWVKERLDRKQKILGMGHAVYKTVDPRAEILKGLCRNLSARMGQEARFRLLEHLEQESRREFEKRGKPRIKANVDFYTGLLYSMMGIPPDLMTPIFVMSLAVGWCAHIIEEKFAEAQDKPALYRPDASYIGYYCGPMGCVYEPIERR
jgi:citrate synthase